MPDLENRLRTALDDLAGEVPASSHPRVELDRRLAARRRRPLLAMAAAAAVVVAVAVAVPVALNRDAPPPADPPVASPAPSAPVGLFELGEFTDDGRRWQALGRLDGDRFCTMVLPVPTEKLGEPVCEPVPTWPDGPAASLVSSRAPLGERTVDDRGNLAQRLVFLTDPRVERLAVRRGDGSPVSVVEHGRSAHAAVFFADFAGPTDGFGYTARDAGGNVLEEAIT